MAGNDLFEQDDKSAKEMEILKKQMADLASKVESASREKDMASATWQEEKARLERSLSEQEPWVKTAQHFNKLVEEDPDEAIARIIAHKKKKTEASKPSNTGNMNVADILKPVNEKLTKIEEEMQKEKEERKIAEMQEAIYESVEYLKNQGIPVDTETPYEIMKFMKTKGLSSPEHVDLAAKSLYSNALIEAQVKGKKRMSQPEGIVLGTTGFEGGEEASEEMEQERPAQPSRKKYSKTDDYYNDDKLWKTLEKSL